jgi:hypothetical protein
MPPCLVSSYAMRLHDYRECRPRRVRSRAVRMPWDTMMVVRRCKRADDAGDLTMNDDLSAGDHP